MNNGTGTTSGGVTSATIPIYYAAKIDTSIPAGSYASSVTYSAVVDGGIVTSAELTSITVDGNQTTPPSAEFQAETENIILIATNLKTNTYGTPRVYYTGTTSNTTDGSSSTFYSECGNVIVGSNNDGYMTVSCTTTPTTEATNVTLHIVSKSYSDTSYHNEELKSLTRYRFDKVQERAQLKQSVSRLVTILFPELEKLVPTLHMASVYALLSELPAAREIASCHLTHLTKLLENASKGRYSREKAIEIREAARVSVGSDMPAKSLELRHTLRLICELDSEITEIESEIKQFMDQISSPILTIPGIGYRMGAMILAEIGDFSRFDSPDKILAYAGASPSTYQSGQMESSYSHMEKRGSRYLRYALINAAKYVCHWDETFGAYLQKKISEGKHYNVAITHAAKKLVRLIYAMEKSGKPYIKTA